MTIINYLVTITFFILLGLFYFLLGTALLKDNEKLETTLEPDDIRDFLPSDGG